ncbi:MAG: hypothetical protein Q8P79_01180 [Nanoarchaeota archaeon]|nr:hypothetical protein [Nanoarchaeota archaeon]
MGLIDRLKESYRGFQENYRNGREEKRLLREKIHFNSMIDRFTSNADIFIDKKVRTYQKLDAIPKPRGFLEEIAYTLGGL